MYGIRLNRSQLKLTNSTNLRKYFNLGAKSFFTTVNVSCDYDFI